MIIRPRARPQGLLQAFARTGHLSSRQQFRSRHHVPVLDGTKDQTFTQYGVPGFLSAKSYQETWRIYQEYLLDQVNKGVQGTERENDTGGPLALHKQLARRPEFASLYNYAAQAHHNHFFWNGLSEREHITLPAHSLRAAIEEWFDSFDQLRDEMLDSAMSMFGNGYVWLMKDHTTNGVMRILCTYNAGSPFPTASERQQSIDYATNTNFAEKLTRPQNNVGSFGATSQNSATSRPGQLDAAPILCVKVWEHQWVGDYGLTGKQDYLNAWWDHVDWEKAHANWNMISEYKPRSSTNPRNPLNENQRLNRFTQESINKNRY